MNPYQSPLNITDNHNAEYHWRRWFLIASLLFFAAALITPAFMTAQESNCWTRPPKLTRWLSQDIASGCVESANQISRVQVTVNP